MVLLVLSVWAGELGDLLSLVSEELTLNLLTL